jgi:hypothetical protein
MRKEIRAEVLELVCGQKGREHRNGKELGNSRDEE